MAPLVQKYCVEVTAIGSTKVAKPNRKRSDVYGRDVTPDYAWSIRR